MSANSKIEWTHHTFNPWRGCTKVSAGCANCYAETLSKLNPKVLGVWGDNGTRVVASESMWMEPIKWNAAAEKAGERQRVFCGSLCDINEDRPDLVAPRKRLKLLIQLTPWLDWLLLSKRPENYLRLFYEIEKPIWNRIWAGTSVENQATADERIPHLLKCPAAVRFLSCEPLLGPIDLGKLYGACGYYCEDSVGHVDHQREPADWVIIGGESGHGSRPCKVAWIRDIVDQCRNKSVPCFVKQLGANIHAPYYEDDDWFRERLLDQRNPVIRDPSGHEHKIDADGQPAPRCTLESRLEDPKGGDMSEWPEDLRVREFPKVSAI